jgi:opacity protein-like surface antigen
MGYSQKGERGMIRFAMAVIALSALPVSFAIAQDSTPKVQVFGGFSLMHQETGQLNGTNLDVALHEPGGTFSPENNFEGWNAEAQYNANRWIGIVADFGGRYGSPITASSISKVSALPDGTAYSFLVGPVISYRRYKKITPYAHGLFGVDRTALKSSTIGGLPTPVTSASANYTDFVYAGGAGLDYKLTQHFALRLAQVDYFHTSVNLNKLYQSAFGPGIFEGPATHQRNLRVSAGIVFQF